MKELWFSEYATENVRFSFRVEKELFDLQTDYQRINIFQSSDFGTMLLLDGCVMLTEKDEFIYHEMITHVPLAVHPNLRRALIIGMGNGGTCYELCRFPNVEHIDLVEIDPAIPEIAKRFFPHKAAALEDPRVHLHLADGLSFVRKMQDTYDLIIVDNTDPYGPGEGLFTKEFYGNCYRALKEDGILVNQHESPYYISDAKTVQKTHQKTKSVFPINRLYQAHIPTYPSGHWLFGFISKRYDPISDLNPKQWESFQLQTNYYNLDLHRGCFALPTYVQALLQN